MSVDIKRETLKQAGYRYIKKLEGNEHLLQEISSGNYEIWANSKGHAGYGILYKNTELEFCGSFNTLWGGSIETA